MAAYDDSYEIADLEKEFPRANASEIRRILRERWRKARAKIDEKLRAETETPLERCPTTGKTIEEEIEEWKETSQAPSPTPNQDEIPSPTDLSQICKLAGTRERSSTAES